MKIKDEYLLTDTPFIAIDLDLMEKNINWIAELAKEANLKLRPHTKTHKSPYIAKLQLDAGAVGISTATLGEAEVMANAGINDILIAFPIIGKIKLERFQRLHERANLIVSLDNIKVAEGLNRVGKKTEKNVLIYVDVDTGLGRMGSSPKESMKLIREIVNLPYITVMGLMSHTGHAYAEETDEGVTRVAVEEANMLYSIKNTLEREGIKIPELSVGASATARVIKDIPHITEVRPGMYVFNDRLVMGAGGATEDECALTVFSTIVAQPYEQRLIIDAGSKTLSSDIYKGGGYGKIKGHDNLQIEKLSEEHGTIKIIGKTDLQVGDIVEIIPNHVCPVINLANHLYGFRKGELDRVVHVEARGLNR